MTRVRTFIPHDVAFPGEPSSVEAFRDGLRTLSRTDALMWCARFNLTLENRGHHDEHFIQNRAARRFLGDEHLDRINAWARREGRTPENTGMFFRVQLLELVCWIALLCEDHPDDGTTFGEERTRIAFTRAALLVSDAWGANVYDERFDATGTPSAARVRAAAVLRRAVALSTSQATLLEATARGASIYSDSLRSACPAFERLFIESTGMTFDEYLAIASALAMLYGVRGADVLESNSALFNAERIGDHLQPAAREKVPRFLAMFSQTPDELAAALRVDDPTGALGWRVKRTYRPLRDRPLLRMTRDRLIVLDPGMMCDALVAGPLFAALKSSPSHFVNTLFGAFGDAVERYVQRLLQGMYPASSALVPRVTLNPPLSNKKGKVGELCDAVLYSASALALFEAKAVHIPDGDVLSADPSAFRSALLTKYASRASKGVRKKGVRQLARAVQALAAGDAVLHGFRAGITVFPVLVTLDDLISAPGTIDILRAEFASAVATEGARFPVDVGDLRVAQLTIMTVTDVELLDRVAETTELLEVLGAYTSEAGSRSFRDHLVEHQKHYGVAIHGRQVTEIADVAFDRAKVFLFGPSIGREA